MSARPLAVGLNLFFLTEEAGGAGTYALELIGGLLAVEPSTRIVIFVNSRPPQSLFEQPWSAGVEWVPLRVRSTSRAPGYFTLQFLTQATAIPVVAARRRLDVVHGVANVIPPFVWGAATVVTLLDLIWIHHPESLEFAVRLGMKWPAILSAHRADRVIAISEAGRRDLITTLGLDPAKIDVTLLGTRQTDQGVALQDKEVRQRFKLGASRFILCVAQKRRHKNLSVLIRALPLLDDDVRLVLVGSATAHEEELRVLARELDLGDRIRFLGWVESSELEALYGSAACFALPSLMEGFGLPVLEAMRRGLPVACSNRSSLPEVVGSAGVLFDPDRVEDVAAALGRILGDRAFAETLRSRGYERCRVFTWEATARATLASYRRALSAKGRES